MTSESMTRDKTSDPGQVQNVRIQELGLTRNFTVHNILVAVTGLVGWLLQKQVTWEGEDCTCVLAACSVSPVDRTEAGKGGGGGGETYLKRGNTTDRRRDGDG